MIRRLLLLGAPIAELDGQPVDLPAKAFGLLAFLAAGEAPQSRDRILALLWPESAEEAARKNLRNLLWSVRKALGEDIVQTSGERLSLAPGVASDVRELVAAVKSPVDSSSPGTAVEAPTGATGEEDPGRLEQALQLYRGPFLDGLSLADAPDFDLWRLAVEEELLQAATRLADSAIALQAARGDWSAVARLSRRAIVINPLHEPFYRNAMEAHARLGERGEALRQYDAVRATLERELGLTPLPDTEALRSAIAAGRFDAPAPPAPSAARARLPRAAPAVPFTGREAELAVLDEELALAAGGRTRVVLLTGELGIGKTRLWREWCAAREAGCIALEARCLQASQPLPLAPLVELFAGHPCTAPLYLPGSPVAPSWLAEVARLLPQVRDAFPSLPPPPALPLEEERRRVFEAFVQVLHALDARPLIMFVDDVHWIDGASLDWLAYLTHRMGPPAMGPPSMGPIAMGPIAMGPFARGPQPSGDRPLLLVLAYRPEEAPPPLLHQVAAWARAGLVRRAPLGRFTPGETAALIAHLKVDPALAHRLHAQSAGNPYFLVELSRMGAASELPAALGDLVRSRVERLGESARAVLAAAAVLEDGFGLPMLQRVAGRGEDETLDALDVLLEGGVLVETGAHFGFAHPVVAAVVRDGLSGARRAVLTRRAVEALLDAHAGHPGPLAARLAGYFAALGEAGEAARYYDLAAGHALSLAAYREAVSFRREALRLSPTPDRRLALGELLSQAGELAAARVVLEEALAAAQTAGARSEAARACLALATTYLPAARFDDVASLARRGLSLLDETADPHAHARAHFLLGAGRLRVGGPALDEAEEHLAEAARLAEQHGLNAVAAGSRFELGNVFAERGNLGAAVAAYRDSLSLAVQGDDANQQVLSHNNAAFHLMLLGDLPAAKDHIAQALALADAFDLRLPRQYLFSTRGEIALAEADWDEAEAWFNRSLAEAASHDNGEHIAKGKANLALVARGRGDLDTALILLEEAATAAAPLAARYVQTQIALWLAELYAERSERQAALAALAQAEERLAGGSYRRLNARAAALRDRLAPRNRRDDE